MIISDLSYLEDVSEMSNIIGGGGFVQADCVTGTIDKKASIVCNTITGGEARVRADCKYFPDFYSDWISKPAGDDTLSCPFGIRGAILETRPT